jgi:hypothetical protein
MVLRFYG